MKKGETVPQLVVRLKRELRATRLELVAKEAFRATAEFRVKQLKGDLIVMEAERDKARDVLGTCVARKVELVTELHRAKDDLSDERSAFRRFRRRIALSLANAKEIG